LTLTTVASSFCILTSLQFLLVSLELAWRIGSGVLELVLNLFTLSHEQVEEVSALLLHVLLVLVDEHWLHDELVEPMEVLHAAPVSSFGFLGGTIL